MGWRLVKSGKDRSGCHRNSVTFYRFWNPIQRVSSLNWLLHIPPVCTGCGSVVTPCGLSIALRAPLVGARVSWMERSDTDHDRHEMSCRASSSWCAGSDRGCRASLRSIQPALAGFSPSSSRGRGAAELDSSEGIGLSAATPNPSPARAEGRKRAFATSSSRARGNTVQRHFPRDAQEGHGSQV